MADFVRRQVGTSLSNDRPIYGAFAFWRTVFCRFQCPHGLPPIRSNPTPLRLRSCLGLVLSPSCTSLTKDKQSEYVGVDVDVTGPQKAIPLLVAKLKEIGAPKGTVIEQHEPKERTIPIE